MTKTAIRPLTIILVGLLFISMFATPSYAQTAKVNNGSVSITMGSPTSYILSVNNEKSLVEFDEKGGTTRVEIKDLNTDEEYYFIRDNINLTIYSSLTNNTVSIKKQHHAPISDHSIGLKADLTDKFIETKSISTNDILLGVGATASVAQVATYILTYFGLAGALPALIINILSAAAIGTASILALNYNYIELDYYQTKRSTTKNGKVYTYWVDTYRNVCLER